MSFAKHYTRSCFLQNVVPYHFPLQILYWISFFSIVVPDRCLATNSVLARCPFAQQQDFLECTIHKQAAISYFPYFRPVTDVHDLPVHPVSCFLIQVHKYQIQAHKYHMHAYEDQILNICSAYDGHTWPQSLTLSAVIPPLAKLQPLWLDWRCKLDLAE